MSTFLLDWLAAIPVFAAPFLLATTGLIINERAGVLNLGVEGIMSVGAVASVIAMLEGGSVAWAVGAAALAGVLLTALFAVLVVVLRIEQVLAGLVTFALGIGISGYVGDGYANQAIAGIDPLPARFFAWLPGPLARIADQDVLTYLALILAVVVWLVLARTEFGLRLRAVGEDAPAADAAGVDVFGMRILAVLAGGLLCGLAGAHLALASSQVWIEDMVSGRGWIAVALVTFSRWHPLRAIGAAMLFGAVEAVIPRLLSSGAHVPVYLIEMTPYLATIIVLAGSRALGKGADDQPRDLGRPFLREERR
ncbi:MAG TPA: ABC transporter permease [Acetobacteraceae bacterium]|nr:ABC transporter permease [Acetobacteraceae bacterium]